MAAARLASDHWEDMSTVPRDEWSARAYSSGVSVGPKMGIVAAEGRGRFRVLRAASERGGLGVVESVGVAVAAVIREKTLGDSGL